MPRRTQRASKSQRRSKSFTRRQYKSDNGMMTAVWGPPMWHVLHTISFNYPVKPSAEDKKHYREMIQNLRYTLPCGKCRENLDSNLKAVPLRPTDMASRDAFSKWMYRLHEHINEMLGKTSGLTYRAVRDRYEHFRARCNAPTPIREAGCTRALKGRKKTKCVLKIVPHDDDCATLTIDERCKV
jgi:hypothetical protein